MALEMTNITVNDTLNGLKAQARIEPCFVTKHTYNGSIMVCNIGVRAENDTCRDIHSHQQKNILLIKTQKDQSIKKLAEFDSKHN